MGKSKESFNDYVRKVRDYVDYWTCSFRESGLSKLGAQLFTTVPERRGTESILRNFRDWRTAAAHWESGDTKWNRRTWLTVAWRFVTSQAMCTATWDGGSARRTYRQITLFWRPGTTALGPVDINIDDWTGYPFLLVRHVHASVLPRPWDEKLRSSWNHRNIGIVCFLRSFLHL